MFYYLSTLGVENGDESARFPMFWKRIDQRSPLPLSSPLPFSFLPPIFPGKRRKTNWAVEPLEFSICPKLTPELSRPPRFRSFSEFLVSLSFFLSFLARRRTETEYLRAFYPLQKEGEELTSPDSNSPRRKGVNLQFYRWNKFARVWASPLSPFVFRGDSF